MKEKCTIALVDDERNILTSLGLALEAAGYKVRTYSDGVAALEGINEDPVDLAILDIKMPRMDGMELLRRLRRETNMPVIFLTSKDEEIDELFGLKMGADDYHRQAVLAAPGGGAGQGRAAALFPQGCRHGRRRDGTRPGARQATAQSRTTHLPLGQSSRDADGDRVPDPAGARHTPGRGQDARRADGRRL